MHGSVFAIRPFVLYGFVLMVILMMWTGLILFNIEKMLVSHPILYGKVVEVHQRSKSLLETFRNLSSNGADLDPKTGVRMPRRE